jgi:carboxymethylenebutenolidase
MRTEHVKLPMRNGALMGAYVAYPDIAPVGCIIAIMEIWGVNDTMRQHAQDFADAGYICLVPDLFWRQEPGVELSDRRPQDVEKAFDLYYGFDYDLGVEDMEDVSAYLKSLPGSNGKIGAVGYCLGGKLCYLMCCRTDIDCAVAYYGTYIEHNIREVDSLHRPFMLHMAMKDRWVQREVNDLLMRKLSPNPLVEIYQYPDADHAFARHGGLTYSKPEADRALSLSLEFFKIHLAAVTTLADATADPERTDTARLQVGQAK